MKKKFEKKVEIVETTNAYTHPHTYIECHGQTYLYISIDGMLKIIETFWRQNSMGMSS